MSTKHLVPPDIAKLYEVHEWRNAVGVLTTAHDSEWQDVIHALRQLKLLRSEILKKGGRKSLIAIRFDGYLFARGWQEKQFRTAIKIDNAEFETPTHKVDCYKSRVALEVEWNNKTEFYDRDLNNFRLLFELRAIDAGIIVTRSSHQSTTHVDKLLPKIEGGGGGGCPIVVFGMTDALYVEDELPPPNEIAADGEEEGEES